MFLRRFAAFFALALTSSYSFAADPNTEAIASYLHTNLEAVRLVPWFAGMHATHSKFQADEQPVVSQKAGRGQILTGSLSEYTCLKLRTYRVKRQESFGEGESGSAGYSTCQWASKYELRSTVETLRAKPRE